MKVLELYENILEKGIIKIKRHEEYIDRFIDNPDDTRMGIALLIRVPKEIRDKISEVENELKKIEKNQYFYPQNDLHITLLDITTARKDFKYTKEQVNKCIKTTQEAINGINPFQIYLNGIAMSDGAILVKGFYEAEMEKLRQRLRRGILDNDMQLDERYTTISSHITIARFKEKLQARNELIKAIEKYKDYDFGNFKVSEVELVYHNWYDSKKEILEKYVIGDVGN